MTTERIRLPRKLEKSVSSGVLAEAGRLHPVGALAATLNMLPLSRVTMTLAEDDLPMQLHDLVEVYGQNGSMGVYRVTKITNTYRKNRRVELAHGLDVFSDATFTASEDFSGTVATFLQKVVNAQTQTIGGVKYWQLGTCADTRPWNKDIKYDNLMECLTEIAKTEEDYMFTFDQSTFPWTLNFIVRDSAVLSEFRLSRNVENCQVTLDDSDLCTKLYLSIDTTTTTADGDTTTTTHEMHEDAAAQAVWGVVVKTAGIKSEDVPDKAAWVSQYFARHAQPALQINIEGWEFNRLTGETLDQMHLGRICRVALPDYNTTFKERIVSLSYPDLLRSPKRVTASLANKRQKAEGAFSDLSSQSSKAASTASENSKKIQNNKTSSTTEYNTIVRRVSTVEGDIETIEGTGVFQNSERITQVAGKFTVDGSGNVHVIDGSNLYLGEGQASLAVYTDGNLTAGAIIQKINGTNKDDKVLANKLEVGATDVAAWGAYTNNTLTGGILVQKINDGSTVTQILGSKINVTATDRATWGVYDNDTLTAGIIVDKINNGSVSIQGSHVSVTATDKATWGVVDNGDYVASVIVNKINGGTVTIDAARVNLTGYVTASQFSSLQGEFNDLVSGNASASSLVASNGNFSNLEITNALTYGGYGNLASRIISYFAPASESGGSITIATGCLDGTTGPSINFNIAATNTYRNGVAAAWTGAIGTVRINNSSSGAGDKTVNLNPGSSVTVYAQAKDNSGATVYTTYGTVTVNATTGTEWAAAVGTVRINNNSSGPGNQTVNLNPGGSVTVYAQAKSAPGATVYTTYGTVTVNAAGYTGLTVSGRTVTCSTSSTTTSATISAGTITVTESRTTPGLNTMSAPVYLNSELIGTASGSAQVSSTQTKMAAPKANVSIGGETHVVDLGDQQVTLTYTPPAPSGTVHTYGTARLFTQKTASEEYGGYAVWRYSDDGGVPSDVARDWGYTTMYEYDPQRGWSNGIGPHHWYACTGN